MWSRTGWSSYVLPTPTAVRANTSVLVVVDGAGVQKSAQEQASVVTSTIANLYIAITS